MVRTIILAGCYLLALVTSGFCLSYGGEPIGIESRSLDGIYQDALKEKGTLRISWGGDGKPAVFCLLANPILTFFSCFQAKSNGDGIIAAFTKRSPDVNR